jgi:hypothetical protein
MRAHSWLEPPPNYAVSYQTAIVSSVLHGGPCSPNQFDIAQALRSLLISHYGEFGEREKFSLVESAVGFHGFSPRGSRIDVTKL